MKSYFMNFKWSNASLKDLINEFISVTGDLALRDWVKDWI